MTTKEQASFPCAVCGDVFSDVGELQLHLFNHIQGDVSSLSTKVFKASRKKISTKQYPVYLSNKKLKLDTEINSTESTKYDSGDENISDTIKRKPEDKDNKIEDDLKVKKHENTENLEITKHAVVKDDGRRKSQKNDMEFTKVNQQYKEIPECCVTNPEREFDIDELDKQFRKTKYRFICDIGKCRYLNVGLDQMRTHVRSHVYATCAVCGDGYFTIQQCQGTRAPNDQPNLCVICRNKLLAAIEVGPDRTYSCQLCPYTCQALCELQIHFDEHSGFEMYKCVLCRKTYGVKDLFEMHQDKCLKRKVEKFNCPFCDESFPSEFQLSMHKRTHRIAERKRLFYEVLQCPFCSQKFKLNLWLQKHLKTHHSESAELE